MAKKNKKMPLPSANGNDEVVELSSQDNYITKTNENQEILSEDTQLFQQDGNYQSEGKTTDKGTHWAFIVYEESAPSDWIEQLANTGLSFAVSPHHDKDINPDNQPKKAHYHVIVSYDVAVRRSNVIGLRKITRGPYPQVIRSLNNTYAYFTHQHNAEKYQYDSSEIQRYNGWEIKLNAGQVDSIKKHIRRQILLENITGYMQLCDWADDEGADYAAVVNTNTMYFNVCLRSFREEPLKTLKIALNYVTDADEQERMATLIEWYHREIERRKLENEV